VSMIELIMGFYMLIYLMVEFQIGCFLAMYGWWCFILLLWWYL